MVAPRYARTILAILAGLLPAGAVFAGWEEGQAAWQRRDFAAAAAEYRPLAAEGNASAMARLGQILFLGLGGVPRDDAEALRLLTAAAASGNPLGQHWLGTAYLLGRGVPKDVAKALDWLGRAADRGVPESLNALGELYYEGVEVPRDEARGVGYFRSAAEKAYPPSLEKMAELRWNGRSMPIDRARAVVDARAAAEAGRPVAQFILGVALLTGEGVAKNPSEAAIWFRRAAERGHPQAAHNLGAMLAVGNGLAVNLPEAYFWLSVGGDRAPANLKTAYLRDRDGVGARLSPQDLAQTRARLANWKPGQNGPGGVSAAAPPPADQASPEKVSPPVSVDGRGRGRMATGTGFVIGRDGTVLTNAHVVESCRSISVTAADGQAIPATLQAKNTTDDLAALKTSLRGDDVGRFRADRPLRSGDEVVVIGFPLSSLLSREANITAGVISAMAGLRGDARHYQITAPVQKGNSGGPLVDMSGTIVGVVSSKLNAMKIAGQTGDLPQNINFAIKADIARRFLDSNSIRYETAAAGPVGSAADVGERIKRVTVFIQCRID
ncbi:trypsin-like peptidase domain-containing protein [Magnetospirillum molischianum]|uniref:TPR repeat n=1 Tax=Magnetospirillum molischianum DSM 120 TaxID=1150626 RepID=H8FRE4_MAGML|nr:trypsin-like peptidase domain-containing protein [Magnetospirillum molischianum]CCG40932.1 TPR repeat [Magnetospirillum molischianum DSM 120]